MVMISKGSRVLCCCSGGQVRSVAARKVLCDDFGLKAVLACGLEKNDPDTLRMLFNWADVVIVVGENHLFRLVPEEFLAKAVHLSIGGDRWGNCFDPNLNRLLKALLKSLVA
jgi:predicted protein tyrosine phosphatase